MTPKSGAKGLQMDSSNDKNQSTIDNMPALDQQMFSGGKAFHHISTHFSRQVLAPTFYKLIDF